MRPTYFDGLPGPTHGHAGLSSGNLAATRHAGEVGNPKAAALEGLAKMRQVRALGGSQAVLPPQPRPDIGALRRLGFSGSDAEVIAASEPQLLSAASSASAMWTANAATVAPSSDTKDGRVHLVPANLSSMFHRSLEAPVTTRVLRKVFADESRFVVHAPLPSGEQFADEGAANHIRLASEAGAFHVFGWGRHGFEANPAGPKLHPARQTREASVALSRLLGVAKFGLFQQDPRGIDGGAFHTDVLACGTGALLLCHELAFVDVDARIAELEAALGKTLVTCVAREAELCLAEAVRTYVFNSQLVEHAGGIALLAPKEADSGPARAFLDRVPVNELHFVEVNASMKNGGGPACLRLSVIMSDDERNALGARVLVDDDLDEKLVAWVERHYRDRLAQDDLRDPSLWSEVKRAFDELSQLLELGSIWDFQR